MEGSEARWEEVSNKSYLEVSAEGLVRSTEGSIGNGSKDIGLEDLDPSGVRRFCFPPELNAVCLY